MDFKKHWENACSEFEALTLKKKPNEEVKKCWLRSNKTLTVTLADFDKANAEFESEKTRLGNRPNESPKNAEGKVKRMEERLASIKKMARSHLIELEDLAHSNDAATDNIYRNGLKYLKKEIDYLIKAAADVIDTAQVALKHIGDDITAFGNAGAAFEGFEKKLMALAAQSKAALAKLKTIIATAEKSKSPEDLKKVVTAYNNIIANAARSIRMTTKSALAYAQKSPLTKKFEPGLANLDQKALFWNNTAREFGDNAKIADIQDAAKEFKKFLEFLELAAPRVLDPRFA